MDKRLYKAVERYMKRTGEILHRGSLITLWQDGYRAGYRDAKKHVARRNQKEEAE